uniref:Uncharacterized protein n=1 Tax=Oryza meridionalis TaxID=40149 RepID=A0A0E0C0V7_9ORYZ
MATPPLLAAATMAAGGQVRRLLPLRVALQSPCPGAVVPWSPATPPYILVAAATSVYHEKRNERIRIRNRCELKKIDSGSHHERRPTFRLLSNARLKAFSEDRLLANKTTNGWTHVHVSSLLFIFPVLSVLFGLSLSLSLNYCVSDLFAIN